MLTLAFCLANLTENQHQHRHSPAYFIRFAQEFPFALFVGVIRVHDVQNSPAWPKIALWHPFLLLEFAGFLLFLAQASEPVLSHSLGLPCADIEPQTAGGPLGEISSDKKSSRQSTEFLFKNTKQERNRFISPGQRQAAEFL